MPKTEEVDYIIDEAEKRIFNIMKNRNQKGYIPIKDILVDSFQQIEKNVQSKRCY